jgi:hypothetical protein
MLFRVKYILFGIVFLFWIPKILTEKFIFSKSLLLVSLFISFFMPIYPLCIGLLSSYLGNTDIGSIIYINSFFFFLLTLVIVGNGINLTKIFNNSSLLIVVITLISYCTLVYDPKFFGHLYQFLVVDKQVAIYSLRNYGNINLLMMFYKTSPLLVFPLSYYLYKLLIKQERNRVFFTIIVLFSLFITLFLSGTRANIFSLFLIILFYISFYLYKKSKNIFIVACVCYLFATIYIVYAIGGFLFDAQEASNMIKFGHFQSYLEYYLNNLGSFVWGQGLGGEFYSSGINKFTGNTELTYFELIRIWGLPISILFVLVLLIPIYNEIKSRKITHLFIAYIAFLFIAGTNPLLLSSTGMIVLVYVFSRMFIEKKNMILLTRP